LKYITDSVFIRNFIKSLTSELKLLGFHTFDEDQMDSFFISGGNAFFLNVAQIELEEYIFTFTDSEYFDDTAVYYKSFNLNATDINVWFEINPLNDSVWKQQILFSGVTYIDELKGRFRKHPLVGDVKYKYSVETLRVDDIMNASTALGQQYAGYLFDFLMNRYIRMEMRKNTEYLHFDRESNKINSAFNKKLTPLNN